MNQDPITWDRLRAIFDYPDPVRRVTERQFDGFDYELQKLGRTCQQRGEVEVVFRDSMLFRLGQERGFLYDGSKTPSTKPNSWLW